MVMVWFLGEESGLGQHKFGYDTVKTLGMKIHEAVGLARDEHLSGLFMIAEKGYTT